MPLAIAFWVLYLLFIIAGFWYPGPGTGWPERYGSRILLLLLLFIIGVKVFGSPIQGM